MPKSVTKVDKHGIKFIDNVEAVIYTLEELERAAFRDIGKLLRKEIRKNIPKRTGALRKNVATWVRKNRKDGQIWLEVGVYNIKHAKKKGIAPAPQSHLVQFGTGMRISKKTGKASGIMPAMPYLDVGTYSNIDAIRKIQAQYLSAIAEENRALGLIDENEDLSDDN